jgi:hypothetical protein
VRECEGHAGTTSVAVWQDAALSESSAHFLPPSSFSFTFFISELWGSRGIYFFFWGGATHQQSQNRCQTVRRLKDLKSKAILDEKKEGGGHLCPDGKHQLIL